MGIFKRTLAGFFNKAEELFDFKPKHLEVSSFVAEKKSTNYEMPYGQKLSPEQQIEENKYMITKLDPKLSFVIDMINEVNPQEDAMDIIARESSLMVGWLAHIVYKENINNFYTLISGKNINSLNPEALVPKSKRPLPKPRKIKCLRDLPLQKSLLN